MEFSQATIDKMKQLYRDHDGTKLSDQEANEAWTNLCEYFKILHEWDQKDKREASETASSHGTPKEGAEKAP